MPRSLPPDRVSRLFLDTYGSDAYICPPSEHDRSKERLGTEFIMLHRRQEGTRRSHIRSVKPRWQFCVGLLLSGMFAPGCQAPDEKSTGSGADALTIRVDREDNGAAGDAFDSSSKIAPRKLTFTVAGFAQRPSAGASQEERAAAAQAAVLDAFCNAVIEARRTRGQSTSGFVEKLSDRLTLIHRSVDEGSEIEIRLRSHGIDEVISVRAGVLQHPPRDFELVRDIFAETGGAFALLPIDASVRLGGRYMARVGCYESFGVKRSLAGDLGGDPAQSPNP